MDPFLIVMLTLFITVVTSGLSWQLFWSDKETELVNKRRELKVLNENIQTNWSFIINELNINPKNHLAHIIWSNCINNKGADLSKIYFRASQVVLINEIDNVDSLIESNLLSINSGNVTTSLQAVNPTSIMLNGQPTEKYTHSQVLALNKLCEITNYFICGTYSPRSITKDEIETIKQINNK